MDRHFPFALAISFFYRITVLLCFFAGRAHSFGDCQALLEKNEFDSARACLQKTVLKKPSDPNIQLAIAKLMGNATSARMVYKN